MRITIYQPQYFPRLHYFNRILNADVFVILDSAQYTKSLVHNTDQGEKRHTSYQSTTPIKSAASNNILSVPLKHNGNLQSIAQTHVDYSQKWQIKHLFELKKNYGKAKMYPEWNTRTKNIIMPEYSSLAQLNISTILWGIDALTGKDTPYEELTIDTVNKNLENIPDIRLKKIIRDKDLGITRPEGMRKGTQWTTEICKKLNASEYFYGGTAEKSYMDLDYYKKNGISLVRQEWICVEYPQQLPQQGYIPNLSILDLLYNIPLNKAQKVMGII